MTALLLVAALILFARSREGGPSVGSAATLPPPPAPSPCLIVAKDGRFEICVYQADDGTFGWRVTGEPNIGATGFESRTDAKIAAWQALATTDAGPLLSGVAARAGLLAYPDGRLVVQDGVAWGRYAFPVLRGELDRDERDPTGLALSVLLSAFPTVNPFRWRPAGGSLVDAALRVQAALAGTRDLLTEDRIALAIFGLPFGNRFALRGRLVELQSEIANGVESWSYRIDGGAWTEGGSSRGDAMIAAAEEIGGGAAQVFGVDVGG